LAIHRVAKSQTKIGLRDCFIGRMIANIPHWRSSSMEQKTRGGGGMTPAPRQTAPIVFKYDKVDEGEPQRLFRLAKSDSLTGIVQLIREGGETHLHSHADSDGFWFVLSGRAQFLGEGDVVIADLGPYEGILMPRGCKYWFRSASTDEPLELLQVSSFIRASNAAPVEPSGAAIPQPV
jgi:mannose-6-phosphate isomerase-like protein (cupin superfamily)